MLDPKELAEIFAEEWKHSQDSLDNGACDAITSLVNRVSTYGFYTQGEEWSQIFATTFADNT